jgi:membrane associated rhomboid family serine protease
VGAGAFVVILLTMFAVQGNYFAAIDWLSAGEAVAGRILAGEWWRAVTALTLHADPGHVVGNLVFGGFFSYLAGQYLGSGVTALAMLLGGAGGNLVNAWLQLPGHRSIGASTAIFATLGVVAAHAWISKSRRAVTWARRAAPLVGAVALLAYIGTGDEHTDIVAHLTGFIAGTLIGILLGAFTSPRWQRPAVQASAGIAALAALAGCWALALIGGS